METRPSRAVWAFIGKSIGVAAAIAAIGAIGWHAAVEYHELRGMLSTVYTSALLTEKEMQVAEQERVLAERSAEIQDLRDRLSKSEVSPVQQDWKTTNYRLLLVYADVIRAVKDLREAEGAAILDTAKKRRYVEASRISPIRERLKHRKTQTNSFLVGAGLMHSVKEDSVEYVVLSKYPVYGASWLTGEVKRLKEPSK